MATITVPVNETLRVNPGYLAFVDSLQAVVNLHDIKPESVEWATADASLAVYGTPPRFYVGIGEGAPKLSVALKPKAGGTEVIGAHIYNAPLLVRDVHRWGLVKDTLGQYILRGWRGVPEEKEMFQRERTLDYVISSMFGDAITNETAVIRVAALLPVAQNGEYSTEFVPRLEINGHNFYSIALISADRLSAYFQMTNGQTAIDLRDMDEGMKMYDWRADHIPDLSSLEKAMLSGQEGQMVLIAKPVENPFKQFFDSLSLERERDSLELGMYGRGLDRSPELFLSGPPKGMTVGDARISRGTEAGLGSLYRGSVEASRSGTPAIYNIRFFTVKPEHAAGITVDALNTIGSSSV